MTPTRRPGGWSAMVVMGTTCLVLALVGIGAMNAVRIEGLKSTPPAKD